MLSHRPQLFTTVKTESESKVWNASLIMLGKKKYSSQFNKKRIEASIKASHRPVSNHSIARVLEHVHTHIARVAEAGVALQTHTGHLPVIFMCSFRLEL